ncbi:MAG: hypothetical protein L6300_08400 [Syntrophaceae bacterium]|nr:hypothetical protein [Syntrophaceae bacterium]
MLSAGGSRYLAAVSDKDGRRAQTDPGSNITKHLLELLSAHADTLSPFGRIRVIEGYMILSDIRHHDPMRDVQLVHHSHVYQCDRYEPFTERPGDLLDRQSLILYGQATAQSSLPVLAIPKTAKLASSGVKLCSRSLRLHKSGLIILLRCVARWTS